MRAYLFIIPFLFFGSGVLAQKTDAMLWTGLCVKGKLIRDLSFSYETQTRFYQNVSAIGVYYNEISLDYEPVKDLQTGIIYRYSRKNKTDYWAGENRLALDLGYGIDIGETGINLKGRARYQWAFERLSVINDVIYPDIQHMFRFKLRAKYSIPNFKRVEPFVSYEFYHALQPSNNISGIDTYRLSGGIDIDLPAKQELTLFYIYEYEYRSVININHIYGIQYSYSLGKLYKKIGGDNL